MSTLITGSSQVTAAQSSGLVLSVAEDAWMGDVQFTTSVDSSQVGGIDTTNALHSLGQSQPISLGTVLPNGPHQVGVTFLNDAYAGTADTDRNLFVTGLSYGGVTIPGSASLLVTNGTSTISLITEDATGAGGVAPTAVSSNAVISLSEDAFQGDAQFTVAVDGNQIGGVLTAPASHGAGQSQAMVITGIAETFTPHDIAITFLNDAYGGSASTDRNLYVDSIQFDGQALAASSVPLYVNGTQHFVAVAPAN